jgi:hypothetical protein
VYSLSIAIAKLMTRSDTLSIGVEKLMTRSDTIDERVVEREAYAYAAARSPATGRAAPPP